MARTDMFCTTAHPRCCEPDTKNVKKSTNSQEVKSALLQAPRIPERMREKKKHTDVCNRSQGKGTRNDLKPHFIDVSSYFLFSFQRSLIHKTAPIRKTKRNHTGRKTKPQIRDVPLFAFTDLFPFFGHGPAMKKSHNILTFFVRWERALAAPSSAHRLLEYRQRNG